jgi:hypothetical protein
LNSPAENKSDKSKHPDLDISFEKIHPYIQHPLYPRFPAV